MDVYTIEQINWLLRVLDLSERKLSIELGVSAPVIGRFLSGKTVRLPYVYRLACTYVLNHYMDLWDIKHEFDLFGDGNLRVVVAGIEYLYF